ncbi:Endocytosis regulator [Schizosaccharomyces pombe]
MPSLVRRFQHASTEEQPFELNIQMESPPLVMYGNPDVSSGALASGLAKLTVFPADLKCESIVMEFVRIISTKRPLRDSCPDCKAQVEAFEKWEFSKEPTVYTHGTHTWPFTFIIPGHFPQTTNSPFINVTYILKTRVKIPSQPDFVFEYPLNLKRSIVTNADKIAQRLFPPTSLIALLELPPVIHPLSCVPVEFQLTGVKPDNSKVGWRLTKISWRIEEQIKAQINGCSTHTGTKKPYIFKETRLLGNNEHKSGWKEDGDRIIFEIPISTSLLSKPICDVSFDGQFSLYIAHQLILETIVVEVMNSHPINSNARILRMKVNLPLTERGGLGVSWDEECPPMFNSVGPSPPAYEQVARSSPTDIPLPPPSCPTNVQRD